MPSDRREFDPLDLIPSPDAIRARLAQTEALADRLRVLLRLSERLRRTVTTADRPATAETNRPGSTSEAVRQ